MIRPMHLLDPWPSRTSQLGRFLLRHGWTPADDVDLRTLARIGLNHGVRFRFDFRRRRHPRPLVAVSRDDLSRAEGDSPNRRIGPVMAGR